MLWGGWNHAGSARHKKNKMKQWDDEENEETLEEGQLTNNKLKKMSRDSQKAKRHKAADTLILTQISCFNS